ncbi:unnamed protein product [Acanthoscelides obtectus]|uniref:Uncharacterized protein n=1 Tax=Acanthoscelides obtectus TaxID=200917 RepID=A0A9P0PN07_ACAOB|nr:unnamed protein product [Acanthoscelides obtectus]CAK1670659.1 hypothetical protein AOBTE_LOCUS27739 [Acanthoscelides obtectus]
MHTVPVTELDTPTSTPLSLHATEPIRTSTEPTLTVYGAYPHHVYGAYPHVYGADKVVVPYVHAGRDIVHDNIDLQTQHQLQAQHELTQEHQLQHEHNLQHQQELEHEQALSREHHLEQIQLLQHQQQLQNQQQLQQQQTLQQQHLQQQHILEHQQYDDDTYNGAAGIVGHVGVGYGAYSGVHHYPSIHHHYPTVY